MRPQISTFTLVGQVIMRITLPDATLHLELDPLEAWIVAGQLERAASAASRKQAEAPQDLIRSTPESLTWEPGL